MDVLSRLTNVQDANAHPDESAGQVADQRDRVPFSAGRRLTHQCSRRAALAWPGSRAASAEHEHRGVTSAAGRFRRYIGGRGSRRAAVLLRAGKPRAADWANVGRTERMPNTATHPLRG